MIKSQNATDFVKTSLQSKSRPQNDEYQMLPISVLLTILHSPSTAKINQQKTMGLQCSCDLSLNVGFREGWKE